ncbi:MAG: discoidin domain-containing protein [Phycisphaerales bacterium]|nr:MAG: discoidin domain-containing protein [Phycisphaerales bacterium]
MCRKLSCWIAVVLLVWAGSAAAELVGHWRLDDGAGTTAVDSTGNGHDGELIGNPQWVEGVYGGALQFAGSPDKVDVPYSDQLNPEGEFSASVWANVDPGGSGHRSPITSRDDYPQRGYIIYCEPGNTWQFWTGSAAGGWNNAAGPAVNLGEWTHLAATYSGGEKKLYINGEVGAESTDEMALNTAQVLRIGAGATEGDGNYFFVGTVDDVAVFDHALTPAEVLSVMAGIASDEIAAKPSPTDTAVDVPRDVVLGWDPGSYAATHDVYLGTSFDDVNDASRANALDVLISQGQADTTYDAGRLEFGQTYFWRIDEVNAAPDNTIFKGDVWSFTVEPLAYPVANVTAASNAVSDPGVGAENTVNGSGLNADDQHSTESTDMWLAVPGADPITIEYAFDRVYKLHEMLVWNYNVQFELLLGFGIKNVTVEYSQDGATWMSLGDVELAQATARADYTANTTIGFDGVAAQYVRLTVNSGFGMMGQYGLSEVRFLYIPAHAREPQPADEAADVSVDTALNWRAGREAAAHEVYLGTDPNALALADTVETPGYTPGPLDLATTYSWRIDEVNEAEAIASWPGSLWSFSTQEYIVVDDFESYDDEDNRIYDTWLDGWVNETGSTVGHLEAPFAETVIVRSGSQSMPLFYDNAGVATAEAEFDLAQDWTASGIQSLSLYFRGAADNTGQLYVKINGTKVTYDGTDEDITASMWQPWNIDLAAVGGNLANVTELVVGIEGAGATGVVYIDDIRLYPLAPEFVTPVEPDAANLVAHYALDGNATDSSGNGRDGVETGSPTYGAGRDGQAVQLDGVDDHIAIADVGISGAAPRTISGWAKASQTDIFAWTDVFGFTGPSGNGGHFDIEAVGDTGNTTLGYYGLHCYGWERDLIPIDLEWHHLAATYDGTAATWYADGRRVGSAEVVLDTPETVNIGKREDNTNLFPGMVDEVRIYNVALSDGEIAWLAGRTESLYKPF